MSHLDIILLILLGGFVLAGFWFGLVHTLGALVGTVVGAYAATLYSVPVAKWFVESFGGNAAVVNFVTFLALYAIVARLVGLLFATVEKVVNFLKIIPFLATLNRLAGGIFGFFEGAFFMGITLLYATTLPLPQNILKAVAGSKVAAWLIGIGKIIMPFLPEALKKLFMV